MKNILFITPYVPSATNAGANYTKQLLEHLSKEHCVDLIYFYDKNDSKTYYNKNINIIRRFVNHRIINVLTCPLLPPIFTARFNLKILFFIKKLIRNKYYDIIYFDFSQTFLYARLIKHHCKVLMSHDVIYQRYKRNKSKLLPLIRISEKFLLSTSNAHIFTFSQKDCDIITEQYLLKSDSTNFFLAQDILNTHITNIENYFILFGMWKRADNYQSLQWLMKNVFPNTPDTSYIIIGGGMPDFLKHELQQFKNVEYKGFVDNPYPIIAKAKALLAILHSGAGVKVKVVETLASGTPVIGTDIAFEGIDNKYDCFMFKADTAEQCINLISSISIPLEKRREFKADFIKNYTDTKILDFLRR